MGYDVHQLVEGRQLWLGGIQIPHTLGLLGHSDADVLIHAICVALLGAANMRDIGYHFPDTSAETDGIDSKILLRKTYAMLRERGYRLGNIDATICAQRPKINPHVEAMRECLAECLETDKDNISIKATTTEHLGFTGREEGISAYAVALIMREATSLPMHPSPGAGMVSYRKPEGDTPLSRITPSAWQCRVPFYATRPPHEPRAPPFFQTTEH